jgi:hypothetical protein
MNRRTFGLPSTLPLANSSVVVFDSNNDLSGKDRTDARARLWLFANQNCTVNEYWAKNKQDATPLRLVSSSNYVATAVRAALPITAVAKASLVNNDYFTVVRTETKDGVAVTKTVIFEYQVDGTFVATAGRTAIDVTATSTATTVAVATAAAIAAAFSEFSVPVPTTAVVTMTNVQSGARFVIASTENVANAGFTVGSATTGVDGTVLKYERPLCPEGSRLQIAIAVGTAPTEFDVAVEVIDDMVLGASVG